ncbi:hypothetical protein JD844_031585 [Phrynosoma platyrhinos]|uniref:Tetratricopeptide repeat domain 12 n=1 Tax=Phrynosoma platyrhinos TaxID=52577 RepID=A0ABQ7T1C4_PHRPL|nr:hypothetical protein JD844_031585 [Phrynosoma platyrhinos]
MVMSQESMALYDDSDNGLEKPSKQKSSSVLSVKMSKQQEERDLQKFLQDVDEVTNLIQGLNSTDPSIQEKAITDTEKRLKSTEIKDENPKKPQVDRTVINTRASDLPNHEESMNPDSFMAAIEKDAEERAKRRKENEALANALKVKGNDAFSKGDYEMAIERYTEGLKKQKDMPMLYTNRAQAYIKLQKYDKAISDCDWALRCDEKCIKALFHMGKAYLAQKQYSKSKECYLKILEIDPQKEKLCKGCLNEVDSEEKRQNEEQRAKEEFESGKCTAVSVSQLLEKLSMPDKDALYYAGGIRLLTEAMQDCTEQTLFRTKNGFSIINDNKVVGRVFHAKKKSPADVELSLSILLLWQAICKGNEENQRFLLTHPDVNLQLPTLLLSEVPEIQEQCLALLSLYAETEWLQLFMSFIKVFDSKARYAMNLLTSLVVEENFESPVKTVNELALAQCIAVMGDLCSDVVIRLQMAESQECWQACVNFVDECWVESKVTRYPECLYAVLGLMMNLSVQHSLAIQELAGEITRKCMSLLSSKDERIVTRAVGLLSHILPASLVALEEAMKQDVVKKMIRLLKAGEETTSGYALKTLAACVRSSRHAQEQVVKLDKRPKLSYCRTFSKAYEVFVTDGNGSSFTVLRMFNTTMLLAPPPFLLFVSPECTTLLKLLRSQNEVVAGNAAFCLGKCLEVPGTATNMLDTNVVKILLKVTGGDAQKTSVQENAAIALGKLCTADARQVSWQGLYTVTLAGCLRVVVMAELMEGTVAYGMMFGLEEREGGLEYSDPLQSRDEVVDDHFLEFLLKCWIDQEGKTAQVGWPLIHPPKAILGRVAVKAKSVGPDKITSEEILMGLELHTSRLRELNGMAILNTAMNDSANESFFEEGLMTTKSHLVSVREDHTGEVTLQLESLTSDPANKGIHHLHGIQRTEAQSTTKDGGQKLTTVTGELESTELSFTDGALLGHQTDGLVTSRPLITISVSASKSTSIQQKLLTTLLSIKERMGNDTAQELRPSEDLFTSTPGKAEGMDPFATTPFDSESLENTGERVTLPTILSLGTATSGPMHTYALRKSGTEPEGHFIETIPTPGKELATPISEAGQQTQVTGQQTKLGSQTFDTTRSPGTLTVAQNASVKSSSAHIFQEMLFEKNGATIPRTEMEQHYTSSVSSPHGGMTRHKTTELRMTEKPTLLTPAQSNTHPFPPLSTTETISSASLHQSSKAEDINQSFQPNLFLFPSQSTIFKKSDLSSKTEEPLHEGGNSNLHHAVDHQTTTQTSLFKPSQTARRESSPLVNLQETTIVNQPTASLLPHSMPQPPSVPPSVYGKPQASITSTFSLGNLISSYTRPTMSSLGTSFHISPPSPDISVSARHSTHGVSEFQQPYMLSTVHGKQTSPNAFVLSLTDSEPLPTSSAPVLMKSRVPGVHAVSERPDLFPPSQTEPQHGSDPSEVAVALTKITTLGNFASPYAGLNASAVAQSVSSSPRPPALPTLTKGEEVRELNTHVPSHFNGQILSNTVSFHTIPASSHVELGVPATTSIAGPENPNSPFFDHTKMKLSPSVSVSFYAKTPLLPGQVHTNSQPPSINPAHEEQQLSTLEVKASSHAKSQAPGGSATFMDESHLVVPSTLSQAIIETNRAVVKGGVDAEPHTAGTLALTTARAQSLASSSSTLMEHILLDSSANPRAPLLTQNETQTPNTSSSPLLQFHSFNTALFGNPKPQTSRISAFVHTEPQLLDESTSAGAGAQTPSLFTIVSLGLPPQATSFPSITSHTTEEKSDGKSSSQTSPPTSQAGIYRMSLPGFSTSVSLGKSPPTFASIASPTGHHNTMNFSLLSSVHMEEDATLSMKTMSTLAVSGAQDLPQRFLGLTQHLNRSGDLGASSLDSLVANGILGASPSLQYLSLLVRNIENMVCLQSGQNTSPVSEELNTDGQGIASAQEVLPLSSAFGLPHLGASSLIQMNPSSVILVKPVFVFLPAETPKVPAAPSTQKEWNHEASLTFTHRAVLGFAPYASNQEQQVETSSPMSTIQHLIRTKSLSSHAFSLAKQNISEPVLSAVPKSTETRSDSLIANLFPQQLREAGTRTKHLGTPNQNNGIQSSILDSPKMEGNHPVSLSVVTAADHHHISDASTAMIPVLERPQTLPPATELLNIPLKSSTFPFLVEPSWMLKSSLGTSRTVGKAQLSTMLMLHTEDHSNGSMTPVTPVNKNPEVSLNTSSIGNMKLPLEVGHLTPTNLTSHSSLSTELFRKEVILTPSEVHYVPNEMSVFQSLPNGKEHKVSVSSNDSYSEAMVAFSVATETSSYPTSTFFSKLLNFHPISSKPPMANKNPRTLPSPFALVSLDPPSHTTLSEEPVEGLMNHQVQSGLSVNMSSRMSMHSYFVKSMRKYDPTTHKRTSLSTTGGQPEPRMSTGETNLSARDNDSHHQMEATHIVPAAPDTDPGHLSMWLVPTDFRSTTMSPDDTVGSVGLKSLFQKLPPHAVVAGASLLPLQDTTVLPVSGGTSIMEMSHHGLKRVLQPTVSGTNDEGFSSSSPMQDQHPKGRRGGTIGTADEFLVRSSSHLEQARLDGKHLEGFILLNDKWTQDATLPTPFPVFSTILSAPELTTLSSRVEGLGGRYLRQRSHFDSLPLHISESFPHLETQAQPTPGIFEGTYNIQTDGGFLADAVSSPGAIGELSSYTSGELVALTRDPTGEGNDGEREEADEDDEGDDHSVADLPPWDSDSSCLAVVSDDACSSGNYTTEMRLQPADRGKTPSSPDSFLARIVLQDNGSCPTLSIKSLVECRHIQIHQNSKSGVANFTIQLFQMVNHSVAYLHCELSVCLSQMAECEQKCLKNLETPSKPSERSGYETLHNVISFGPVLKTESEFAPGLATGSPLSMTLLSFLVLLTGAVGLTATIMIFWLRQRCQTKMAAHMAPPGSESP